MKIIIAGNKNLETHNLITKFIRIFTVPLLNSLPSSLIKKLAKKSSEDAKGAIEKASSAYAVEISYTRYNRSLFSRGILQGIADLFWHHIISQAKALRNRLKIVEDNLLQEIVRLLSNNQKEINILSVAGGSLRAIIHSIDKLHKQNVSHKIKIINIDKDPKAIELGKKAASELAVDENFTWINDDAKNIKSLIAPNSVYIVEMIGLLDYSPEEKGIEIIKQIYNETSEKPGIF